MTNPNAQIITGFAGIISLLVLISLATGQTYYRGLISRDENPGRFWHVVISLSLLALFCWVSCIETVKPALGRFVYIIPFLIPLGLLGMAMFAFLKGSIELRGGFRIDSEESPLLFMTLIVLFAGIAVAWLAILVVISLR